MQSLRLYPICRGIAGDGVRRTLDILADDIPLERHEIPTGAPVLDWTVPKEWNIEDAYAALDGERVVDFQESNLRLVSYSTPTRRTMSLAEVKPRLHSLPQHPTWTPWPATIKKLGAFASRRASPGSRL
jgi:aminopeptidase-like protein